MLSCIQDIPSEFCMPIIQYGAERGQAFAGEAARMIQIYYKFAAAPADKENRRRGTKHDMPPSRADKETAGGGQNMTCRRLGRTKRAAPDRQNKPVGRDKTWRANRRGQTERAPCTGARLA